MTCSKRFKPITIDKPSHLCVASCCEFGRTTMLRGYIVSSVGEYVCPSGRPDSGRFTTIGCDRLYETFVFKWRGKRCEIKDCPCGGVPEWEGSEIDSLPANTRAECIKNHERLVRKWRRK